MAAVYFGNRGSSLRLERGALAQVGVRADGPVLAGQMSVREGQQLAVREWAQRGQSFLNERQKLLERAGRL